MPRYTYVALDSRGQELTGIVDATSTNEAIAQLRQSGFFPTKVSEEGATAAADGKAPRGAPTTRRAERASRSKNIVLFQRKSVKPKTLMIFLSASLAGCSSKTNSWMRESGFTVVELLIVITIILVLAGLVLATSGYVQAKAKGSRAEAEIAAISAALENYRADNGIYPTDTANGTTNILDARTMFNPTAAHYAAASFFLYKELSGDSAGNRIPTGKSYFSFKPHMLLPKDQAQAVSAIADPFGHSYGYSTAYQSNPSKGYNPTFDLWSTAGTGTGSTPNSSPTLAPQDQWIKNW